MAAGTKLVLAGIDDRRRGDEARRATGLVSGVSVSICFPLDEGVFCTSSCIGPQGLLLDHKGTETAEHGKGPES